MYYVGNLATFSSMGFVLAIVLASFCMMILHIIAFWKIFTKLGLEGWKSIIPFYNNYLLCKYVWGSGGMFLLMFLPIGNIIVSYITWFKIGRVFNKGTGFCLGLIFFQPIFALLLAFDSSEYSGPNSGGKTATIITSFIAFILYVIVMVVAILGLTAVSLLHSPVNKGDYNESVDVYENDEEVIEDEEATENEEVTKDTSESEYFDEGDGDYTYDKQLTDENGNLLKTCTIYYDYDKSISSDSKVFVSSSYLDVKEDSSYSCLGDLTIYSYIYELDSPSDFIFEQLLADSINNDLDLYSANDKYSNIKLSEVCKTDTCVAQRMDYTYDNDYKMCTIKIITPCEGGYMNTCLKVEPYRDIERAYFILNTTLDELGLSGLK